MRLTREAVARKMMAYLYQEIFLDELVAWALNLRNNARRRFGGSPA